MSRVADTRINRVTLNEADLVTAAVPFPDTHPSYLPHPSCDVGLKGLRVSGAYHIR